MNQPPKWLLPAIVLGQVLATSTWFAPNAVIVELQGLWAIEGGVGLVTTAVQLGFIAGTLGYAALGLADRFHAGNVFLVSALIAAFANVLALAGPASLWMVLTTRFVTGFCLAGVYPVGMRIAAGWYGSGLGRALGFLVGALVLGTASPHLLNAVGGQWDWRWVIAGSSLAAACGGLLVWRVPEGPHLTRGAPVRFSGVLGAFRRPAFRAAVLGYFGHMWELYALWAFIPVWLLARGFGETPTASLSFVLIATGAVGCALGGLLAGRLGSGAVALTNLGISGACCLLSPLMFFAPAPLFVAFIIVWGFAAAGDSPQFSALNAASAPRAVVGSALTLTNSLGFAISIVSLFLLEWLQFLVPAQWLLLPLALGPALGLWYGRGTLRGVAERQAARAHDPA
jgi:MFS family permease